MSMTVMALDTETGLITRARPLPPVVCAQLYDGVHPARIVKHDNGLKNVIRTHLMQDNVIFVGMNIAYDFGCLGNQYPDLIPLIFEAYRSNRVTDVAVRQKLWDIANGRNVMAEDKVKEYTLEMLAKLVIDVDMKGKHGEDARRMRYMELWDIPVEQWPDEAVEYAKLDVVYSRDIWEEQCKGQDDICGEFVKTYSFFTLSLMQVRGMRTNPVAVAKFKEEHERVKAELEPALFEAGLLEWDRKKEKIIKKEKPAKQRIWDACVAKGIEPPLTDTGKERKREGLEIGVKWTAMDKPACLISGDSVMLKRSEYVSACKMIDTYLPIVEAGLTGPVTTRFYIAATGRTTSSTPSPPLVGGNLQNPPREGGLRECFYPRKGHIYLAADVSGAEMHTLAQSCKDLIGYSTLGDMLNEGRDPHAHVGAQLLGISYEEMTERLVNEDEDAQDARQDAKAANFGYPGGMGVDTFCLTQLKQRERFWPRDKAEKLKEAWLAALPEITEYFALCQRETKHGDFVVVMNRYGAKRRVQRFTQLANTRFQAPTACGALDAVNEVTRRCYVEKESALYGAVPCNFIHDEMILEVPERLFCNEMAVEMSTVMATEFSKSCPDYPVKVEPVAMRYWSKKAKSIFNEKGELQIWPL